jgi:hypothetical protein
VIPERARLSLVEDHAFLIDDVEPFGPARIERVGGILDRVDDHRDLVMEALDEIVRDGDALGGRLGLRITDLFFFIRVHLPLVGGMRLLDVERQEPDAIAVTPIHRLHAPDRAPERRSREASKNEHERPIADRLAEANRRLTVQRDQRNVRGAVADFQLAFLPLVVAKHADYVARPHLCHDESHGPDHQNEDGEENFLQHVISTHAGRTTRV